MNGRVNKKEEASFSDNFPSHDWARKIYIDIVLSSTSIARQTLRNVSHYTINLLFDAINY